MAATFLNVDLEIEAPETLDHVCCELLKAGALKLYNGNIKGGFLATFEVASGRIESDPNSIIASFCEMLKGLDEQSKATWDRAHRRTFDIGYETANLSSSLSSDLKNEVLAQVAALGADIRITFYPHQSAD